MRSSRTINARVLLVAPSERLRLEACSQLVQVDAGNFQGAGHAFTIAFEIGDITRFPAAKKLCDYTGLCPRVHQSGESDRRGPLTRQGPK